MDPQSELNLCQLVLTSPPGTKCNGYSIISENSEQLLRRIVFTSEYNADPESPSLIDLFNSNVNNVETQPYAKLSTQYKAGAVNAVRRFGVDKGVLMLVGPFPDLYAKLSLTNALNPIEPNETNSLTSAETNNGKFPGHSNLFAFYSKVLEIFDREGDRKDEVRDAAKTVIKGNGVFTVGCQGLKILKEVAIRSDIGASSNDSEDEAIHKYLQFYDRVHSSEGETREGRSLRDTCISDAMIMMDREILKGSECDWKSVRPRLAEMYDEVGLKTLANYVR
jgi:hypothetical protein